MALTNLTFNKSLLIDLAQEGAAIADALNRVQALSTDETTLCVLMILFNLSQIPECRVLAGTKAVNIIVDVISQDCNIVSTKLCIATLCNMSNMAVFHEQLSTLAISSLIKVLASPQFHMSVKRDAIQAVYNLVTLHPPCREVFIESDGIVSLWKLLKVQGGGHTFICIYKF